MQVLISLYSNFFAKPPAQKRRTSNGCLSFVQRWCLFMHRVMWRLLCWFFELLKQMKRGMTILYFFSLATHPRLLIESRWSMLRQYGIQWINAAVSHTIFSFWKLGETVSLCHSELGRCFLTLKSKQVWSTREISQPLKHLSSLLQRIYVLN